MYIRDELTEPNFYYYTNLKMKSVCRSQFFYFCILFLIPFTAQSQNSAATDTTITSEVDQYQRILLDGVVSYRNEVTKEIISQTDYIVLCEATGEDGHDHHDHTHDYWQCDKINPYKNVVLDIPFKIKFDQTSFTHPVDKIVVTSRFGRRRRGPHRGLDLDLITGDPVRSVLPGKVRFVGYSRGHGKTIVVRHANEVETVYAHLSAYKVKINDMVSEGQIIGLGGNTGNSRGSHLHLEVRYKGVCIHPEYVFNFDGSKTIYGHELWITNEWQSPKYHSSYRKSKLKPLRSLQEAIAAIEAEPKFHEVRKGDTLSHIAEKYRLGLRDLCRLNSISRKSILRIGQVLKVR